MCNLDEIADKYYKQNDYFPDIYEIIKYHSTHIVERICLTKRGEARAIEHMLRKSPFDHRGGTAGHFNMCPLCQKEDIERTGRSIIHVSHQISGVNVCYKHGIPFDKSANFDCSKEQTIALFGNGILNNQPDCTLSDLQNYITESDVNAAITAGYLEEKEGKRLLNVALFAKGNNSNATIRFFAWKFAGNADVFCKNISRNNQAISDNELFRMNKFEYGIGEYVCKRCGKVFHMAAMAVEAGEVCPNCHSGMTEDERLMRILKNYKDGNYILRDGKLVHLLCGNEVRASNMFWLSDIKNCNKCHGNKRLNEWKAALAETEFQALELFCKTKTTPDSQKTNKYVWIKLKHKKCNTVFDIMAKNIYKGDTSKIHCPNCRRNHQGGETSICNKRSSIWEKRLGERRTGVRGMGCQIVGYLKKSGSYVVAIVQFDNGLERTMTWDTFNNIGKKEIDYFPEQYIGIEGTWSNGTPVKIVDYKGSQKIVVASPDGKIFRGKLRRFKQKNKDVSRTCSKSES